MEYREAARIARNFLRKTREGLAPPNIKIHYKTIAITTVIKSIWH